VQILQPWKMARSRSHSVGPAVAASQTGCPLPAPPTIFDLARLPFLIPVNKMACRGEDETNSAGPAFRTPERQSFWRDQGR